MRKFIVVSLGVVAALAATASLATGATKAPAAHSSVVRCGGLYQQPCVSPVVTVRSAVACSQTGKVLTFPIRLRSVAGLARATVKVGGRTVRKVKFKGSPVRKTVNVRVNTRGDKPGLHTITVKATDTRGKSASGRAHFTICRPAPVFTG
jgi:hypothetical protein